MLQNIDDNMHLERATDAINNALKILEKIE